MKLSIARHQGHILGVQKSFEHMEPSFIGTGENIFNVVFQVLATPSGITFSAARRELLHCLIDGRPVDELRVTNGPGDGTSSLQHGPQLGLGLPLVLAKPGEDFRNGVIVIRVREGPGQGLTEEEGGVEAGADWALHDGQLR